MGIDTKIDKISVIDPRNECCFQRSP